MKKVIVAMLLALYSSALAEQCYFQTRRTSYDSGTRVKKISCQTLKNVQQDVHFYNGNDNYARYYGQIVYNGGNVVSCKTTTSTGYCDQVEYTEFGNYLRDFLNSSARKKNRK